MRDRVLPLSPGRVERHGFENKRHGTLSLYAALNVRTGEVRGKTTACHLCRRPSAPRSGGGAERLDGGEHTGTLWV